MPLPLPALAWSSPSFSQALVAAQAALRALRLGARILIPESRVNPAGGIHNLRCDLTLGPKINSGLTIFPSFANHDLTVGWSIDADERQRQQQVGPCGRPAFVSATIEQTL
jgi:hypothetical protein